MQASAQLNTLNFCLHSLMMCPDKRMVGGGGMRMLLRKIWLSFLDTPGCRRKGMLSHIPAHSFPSLSWTQGEKRKKNCLAAFLCSLPGDPEAEPGGRERRGSDFLPPNRQRLPRKRDAVQLDLWGDVGVILTQGRTVTHAAQRLRNGFKLHR